MNKFRSINTEYLRSSRTIETVEVCNSNTKKLFYVYNYEGNSFRIFDNVLNLIDFFEFNSNKYLHFDTEQELDNYFSKVFISSLTN